MLWKIKPLEWRDEDEPSDDYKVATCALGELHVYRNGDRWRAELWMTEQNYKPLSRNLSSLEAAMLAANSYYRQRLSSALTPATQEDIDAADRAMMTKLMEESP